MFFSKYVCASCGSQNIGKVTKGSLWAELSLWVLGFLTLGILLPVAVGYSLWRMLSKFKGCRKCQSRAFYPLDSIAGRRMSDETERMV